MLTRRGWWLLLSIVVALAVGLLLRFPLLNLAGLALCFWFAWEWFLFTIRTGAIRRRLTVRRLVLDDRGPVHSLWAGKGFTIRVEVVANGLRLPFAVAADRVPFGVEWESGATVCEGEIDDRHSLTFAYRVHCERPGLARFEGVKVQTADLQGLFFHAAFLQDIIALPILPRLTDSEGRPATTKRFNLLPPPGVHRLRQPGTGSELLDLRDYMPGDPPRTIAWKVSARRDRLITKEFESEVPVRCTLFLDSSSSVLVPGPEGKAIHRLVDIAAGVLQAGSAIRDLTGLCLFDEQGVSSWRTPGRTGRHHTEMLRALAEAASGAAQDYRVEPEMLVPLAFTFAKEVYPHHFDRARNALPWWVAWFLPFPRYTRSRTSMIQWLHRRKNLAWLLPVVSPIVWLLAQVISERARRLGFWRKQLAAVLSVRYGLAPGGLALLLEDDDQFALALQQFLAEHQVPFSLPLYDPSGKYRFAAPGKIDVLAGALLRAVQRGHDNELFILLVDLLELDDNLAPLVRAIRVAVSRHHQVLVVCPWPAGLAPPSNRPRVNDNSAAIPPRRTEAALLDFLRQATERRLLDAYRRLRRTFGRIGVQVVCAASDEPVPLILDRMENLRMAGRRRR